MKKLLYSKCIFLMIDIAEVTPREAGIAKEIVINNFVCWEIIKVQLSSWYLLKTRIAPELKIEICIFWVLTSYICLCIYTHKHHSMWILENVYMYNRNQQKSLSQTGNRQNLAIWDERRAATFKFGWHCVLDVCCPLPLRAQFTPWWSCVRVCLPVCSEANNFSESWAPN